MTRRTPERRRAAERPQFDGDRVMPLLGIEPSRQVGQIMTWLMELKRDEGELSDAELETRIREYYASLD